MFASSSRQNNSADGGRRRRSAARDQANVLLGNLSALVGENKSSLTKTFQPGQLGMRAEWSTGVVTEVVCGGQAHTAGVANGMIITHVNDMTYSERALDACRNQGSSYVLTFSDARSVSRQGCATQQSAGRRSADRGSYSRVPLGTPTVPQQGPLPAGSGLKLLACIGLDMCGNASFLLPELGEATDIAWAPVQAIALRAMFDSNMLPLVGLVEELLPGTDLVPTATIGWILEANGYFDRRPAASEHTA